MKSIQVDDEMRHKVVKALSRSVMFNSLKKAQLWQVAERGELFMVEAGITIMKQGEVSDAFFIVLQGEALVHIRHEANNEVTNLGRLGPTDGIGEQGVLLGEPRTATVIASTPMVVIRFDAETFFLMYERVPGFGLATSRSLAKRLQQASRSLYKNF